MTSRMYRKNLPKRFRRSLGRLIRQGRIEIPWTRLWESIEMLKALRGEAIR